jgi:hypothetical protein
VAAAPQAQFAAAVRKVGQLPAELAAGATGQVRLRASASAAVVATLEDKAAGQAHSAPTTAVQRPEQERWLPEAFVVVDYLQQGTRPFPWLTAEPRS